MTHRRIVRVFKVKAIFPFIKIREHQLQRVNKSANAVCNTTALC